MIEYIPNEVLAWRTAERSRIALGGIIRIDAFDGGARVHIRMHYNPRRPALQR